MIEVEVKSMEDNLEKQTNEPAAEENTGYVPRPMWQVWLARIAAGIVILGVILYYWHIASGGL